MALQGTKKNESNNPALAISLSRQVTSYIAVKGTALQIYK